MQIVLETFGVFISKKTQEEIRHAIRAEDMKSPTKKTFLECWWIGWELSESGLVIKQMDTMTLNYDKYNPTRRGSFACINIKNPDDLCFQYSVQCGIYKICEEDHGCDMYLSKKNNNTLNWDNLNFPSSNIDIDTFQENNEGLVSVNVYVLDDEGRKSILLYRKYRKVNVAKATHHIDLLKFKTETTTSMFSSRTITNP